MKKIIITVLLAWFAIATLNYCFPIDIDPGKQISDQGLSTFISSVFLTSSAMDSGSYQNLFGDNAGWGVGIILVVLLIALLIFLELSRREHIYLHRVRPRFQIISTIIGLVFLGNLVYKVITVI